MIKYVISLFLVVSLCNQIQSQKKSIPALEISHFDDFKTYRSFPSMCVENIYQDQSGKLWLKSCGAAIQLSAHLFGFDGYNFDIVEGELSQLGNQVFLAGTSKDTLYGYDTQDNVSYFFKMNLVNQHLLHYDSIPYHKNMTMSVDNDKVYQYFAHKNILNIRIWEGASSVTKNFDLKTIFGIDDAYIDYVKIRNDQVWIWDLNTFKFYTIDLIGNNNSEIDLSPYFQQHKNSFFDKELLEYYFTDEVLHMKFLIAGRWYFKSFQLYLNQQISLVEKIELKSKKQIHAFADNKSNLLYVYEDEGKIKAYIELKGNIKLDASEMLKDVRVNRIRNIIGEDFLKEFYLCTEVGFSVIKVKLKGAIQKVVIPASLRSLNELEDGRLLVNSQSRVQFIHDLNTGEYIEVLDSTCISMLPILIKRKNEYWGFDKTKFVSYNPYTDRCQAYTEVPYSFRVFDFYKEDFIIGSHDNDNIVIYDINTQSARILGQNGVPVRLESIVHNVFVDSKERIWVVNAEGLYQIDIETNTATNITASIEGFNFKLLSIAEGDNGDFWLGTSLSGLVILNPDTKEFKHISSDQGLSNNTVASIIKDNNNMYWLGTYNGIALLNAEGELLTNFYEKDGLANNESNRYSATLLANGQVVIGSIEGFTILDPDIILRSLFDKKAVNIYLTKAIYLDKSNNQSTDHKTEISVLKEIKLLPQSRNLTLEFAVSNYIRPLENRYAYRIDAFHKDWIELGNKNSLELRDLPAGKYTLYIKGGDNLGNWSEDNLELQINAQQFFYKSGWFYTLVLGLLTGIILLWITSLRKQVKSATEKILEDKEIIERQAKKLKELDEAKSDFFTDISHELRTPLTIISGMIDQIRSKPDAWLERGSQMIKENTVNLLNLVNQILDLRKLESNNLALQIVQGDIISYIKYLIKSHQHLANQRKIHVAVISEKDELIMDYDPEKVLRIMSNLLSNAIKFNKEGGQVNINLSIVDDNGKNTLQIKVQDTGQGISDADLQGIFDRFYQAESEVKPSYTGTGIGLSLTKQLVELMNGTITVNSILGSGSIFSIHLPITKNSEIKDMGIPTAEYSRKPEILITDKIDTKIKVIPEALGKKEGLPNLLIVEDNESIITIIIAQLENSYNISFQLDGQQGINAAIEEVPDIIISDVMMPIKDGFQLCNELKTDERTSHIPIILLTAKTDQESKIMGLEQRADAYLSKPFNPEELKLRMSNLLSVRDSLQGRFKHLEAKTQNTETPKEDVFVIKLRNAILENLDDDTFGVMQLCRAASISRSQLHNKVKALTGLSASNYIRSVRLQKAREMLQNSNLNVSEVAYAVGFQNPNYFSSSYKEEFGENPSKTRK